jgi:Uncharacterized protein conserved in bacteria (DUF2330)
MRSPMKLVIIVLALVALACAPAPHAGDEIAIVEESAVIVWDPATKTEHFIRRATFRGKEGHDFGFLVPTPAAPTLAEVDDAVFDKLEERTRRETVYVTRKTIDWTPLVLMSYYRREDASGAAPPVEVLSTQKVAGYEVVVLSATDAGALQKWLADHGYASTPDLTEWLDAYVKKQWKITAFKIDASKPELAARTSAVKMSFTTDRPFFPYREPASQRRLSSETFTSRALRIWFLGPERVEGTIGEGTFWPGIVRRSETLPEPLRGTVANLTKLSLLPSVRMTAFMDQSTIRAGSDELFFARSAAQSAFVEPPNVHETVDKTHVPLDLVALGVIVLGLVAWRVSRRV